MVKLFYLLFFCTLFIAPATAQQYSLSPFTIDSSPLMKELRSIRAANPELTADQLVEAANAALEKNGIGYTFYFDTATCEKIEKAFAAKKPGEPAPNLKATLVSVGGEKASLLLPQPNTSPCTHCSVTLPVLQATSSDFITLISGRNIKFLIPEGLLSDEVVLLDAADPIRIKKRFPVPFKAKPLGVLYDENGIYLEMPDPQFSDLAVIVFDEGTFQFATRKEAESNGKPAAFDMGKNAEPGSSYLTFQNRDKKLLVKFPKDCN
jgi:hypothetical protein